MKKKKPRRKKNGCAEEKSETEQERGVKAKRFELK